jgi:hypothetical protein
MNCPGSFETFAELPFKTDFINVQRRQTPTLHLMDRHRVRGRDMWLLLTNKIGQRNSNALKTISIQLCNIISIRKSLFMSNCCRPSVALLQG